MWWFLHFLNRVQWSVKQQITKVNGVKQVKTRLVASFQPSTPLHFLIINIRETSLLFWNFITLLRFLLMNSMKLVISLHFISWKRLQRMLWHLDARVNSHQRRKQTRFSHLLSSLVWIDQYNECNGMTTFMEFMNDQKT